MPSTDKSNLVKTFVATITEHVQIQNIAAPIMCTVSNIAVNQQQAEITKTTLERLSATPTLQENLDQIMSRITQMENTIVQTQANIPVLNLQ